MGVFGGGGGGVREELGLGGVGGWVGWVGWRRRLGCFMWVDGWIERWVGGRV